MSVPQNITKAHLLKALEHIDNLGVPKNAHSSTYDVVWEGKRYPPKLVVSYANKFANGEELPRSEFQGGRNTLAFNLLQNEGFAVVRKEHKIPFFTIEEFDTLNESAGLKYNNDEEGWVNVYEILKSSYAKVEYWANEVCSILYPEGVVKIRKRPTNQGNVIERYQWAKIYPTQILLKDKWLAFTVSIEEDRNFNVKFDTVGLDEKTLKRRDYLKLVKNYENDTIVWKSSEPNNWDDLIERSVKHIEKISSDFNSFKGKFDTMFDKKENIAFMKYNKSEIPAFYCVGFHYYSTEKTNQLPRFINEGVWENGYKDKFIEKVKSVRIGSAIVAKTSYTMKENGRTIPVLEVHARGIVTGNRGDGIILDVEWEKDFERRKFIGQGGYRNTISRVWNNGVIDKLFLDSPSEIALEISNYDTPKPSNTILFGPPGTGKTYATKELAVSIARPDFEFDTTINLSQREQLNKVYEELVQTKQIMFSTFHQSLSYEDFVEGIKPETNEKEEITYKVKSGIFKELCELAETGDGNNIDEAIAKFIAKIDADGEQTLETSRGNKFTVTYNGGTTFRINPENSAHENPDYPASIDNIKKLNIGKDVKGMYNPSYVKSILKHLRDKYGLKKGSLNKANKKNHVLIIDEINRGNVSSIFGELITLLEPDKRRGQKEALEVTLPYSKEPFQVPSNIHIIGTMNTADRSVEALDTALRRRFSFSEVMPNPALLSPQYAYWDLLWDYQDKAWNNKEYETKEKSLFEFTGVDDLLVEKRKEIWGKMKDEGRNESQIEYFSEFTFSGIKLDVILKTINTRIEALLDREHTIGHSYFFEIYNSSDKYLKLEEVFRDKIIPLLQEYFFGDYSKIGLVLGDEFIDVEKVEFNKIFAYNTKFEPVDLGTKYSLKPFDEVDFDTALQSLMGYAED